MTTEKTVEPVIAKDLKTGELIMVDKSHLFDQVLHHQFLERIVYIDYTNYRGQRRWRPIIPKGVVWSVNNAYHPEPQWLLDATDIEDDGTSLAMVPKLFAMKNIHEWRPHDAVP